jgi:hypothetical protein
LRGDRRQVVGRHDAAVDDLPFELPDGQGHAYVPFVAVSRGQVNPPPFKNANRLKSPLYTARNTPPQVPILPRNTAFRQLLPHSRLLWCDRDILQNFRGFWRHAAYRDLGLTYGLRRFRQTPQAGPFAAVRDREGSIR